jgi:hypothetical protein
MVIRDHFTCVNWSKNGLRTHPRPTKALPAPGPSTSAPEPERGGRAAAGGGAAVAGRGSSHEQAASTRPLSSSLPPPAPATRIQAYSLLTDPAQRMLLLKSTAASVRQRITAAPPVRIEGRALTARSAGGVRAGLAVARLVCARFSGNE